MEIRKGEIVGIPAILGKYPAVLTNKDWQQKKGNIGKILGKTGLGEALKDCESAHGAIDWKAFDTASLRKANRNQIEKAKAAAQKELKTVDRFAAALDIARATAKKTEAKAAKIKVFGASVAKAAGAIAKTAGDYHLAATKGITLEQFDELMTAYVRLDRCNTWKDVMKDGVLSGMFLEFLKKEYSMENLDFLLATKTIKTDDKTMKKHYDLYVATGSKKELNLPGTVRKAYKEAMEGGDARARKKAIEDVIDQAELNISDTFSRFILQA